MSEYVWKYSVYAKMYLGSNSNSSGGKAKHIVAFRLVVSGQGNKIVHRAFKYIPMITWKCVAVECMLTSGIETSTRALIQVHNVTSLR